MAVAYSLTFPAQSKFIKNVSRGTMFKLPVNLFEIAPYHKTPVALFSAHNALTFLELQNPNPSLVSNIQHAPLIFATRYWLGAVHCRPGLKSLENDMKYGVTVSRCDIEVRMGFIRKVYGILAAQLILTTMVGATFMNVAVIKVGLPTNMQQEWILHSSSSYYEPRQ
jgi:hypothetical protein